MRQSHNWHTPRAMALGGACLVGLGVIGCARENGLDLAKQDARTDSAITERANESILRSKQELAGGKGSGPGGLAETASETDDRPALASRWKAPFKGAGNLLKRKPDEPAEDPFLSQSNAEKPESGKQSLAALAEEKALAANTPAPATRPASTAKTATEKKVALADAAQAPAPDLAGARPKSVVSSDAQAALDDFLKSQEPVTVDDRALVAGYESAEMTRKPGTKSRSTKTASETFRDDAPATSEIASADAEHRTLGSRSLTAAGQARPFPAESPAPQQPAAKPTSKLRQQNVAATPSRKNPLAASTHATANPLVDDAPAAVESPRTTQSTGREIAALLKKAKSAGDHGELEQAMSYAIAASDLAEQCNYEFRSDEQSPERLVEWLSDKQAEAEQLSRGRDDRRELLAARRHQRSVAASPTTFSTPTAEQVFSTDVEELAAAGGSAPSTATPKVAVAGSAFQSWAEGVGREQTPNGRSPEWPILSHGELAASDELWQPSRSGFDQSWTELTRSGQGTRESETRLASAESDAPAFVATADARTRPGTGVTTAANPMVQLGQPTDLAMGFSDTLRTSGDPAYGQRRGPRLAAPPPLSIEDGGDRTATAARKRGTSRVLWYSVIGTLSLLVLVAFRRWAYRSPAETAK